jgi:hypothetical protein
MKKAKKEKDATEIAVKLRLRLELRCTNRQFEIPISSDTWSDSQLSAKKNKKQNDLLMPNPPQSPDYNVFVDMWSSLDRKAKAAKIKTISGLKRKLTQDWNEMDRNVIRRSVDSLRARLADCEELQGARTHS